MAKQPAAWRTTAFFLGPSLLFSSMLLAIALLFVYPLVFLLFVPALLFLLGLVLTLVGPQPWWLKGLGMLVPVSLPIVGFYAFFQGWMTPPRPEHALVLLPAAFRGEVDLVQNELCGAALRRPAGQLTITVPASGLVVTSSLVEEGLLEAATYCRVDEQGRRLDTLRQVVDSYGRAYEQAANGEHQVSSQQVGIFIDGDHAQPPADWEGPLPDENQPAPGGPLMKPVRYVSFLVTCLDSLVSPHQSPAFGQKLRRRVDVPTECYRLRKPVE